MVLVIEQSRSFCDGRMVTMIGKLFSNPKWMALGALGIILIALLGWAGWRILSLRTDPQPTPRPVVFTYCGADLEEICVLSFGRDGNGDTVINLFVPEKGFLAFYLKVIRLNGESLFECHVNDALPESVYCIGDAVNLEERLEISVISEEGDTLLATGRFTVTGILIASASALDQPSTVSTSTPKPRATPTKTGTPTSKTPDPGTTLTPSYPNYPSYP